jgi:hypothetical protein
VVRYLTQSADPGAAAQRLRAAIDAATGGIIAPDGRASR